MRTPLQPLLAITRFLRLGLALAVCAVAGLPANVARAQIPGPVFYEEVENLARCPGSFYAWGYRSYLGAIVGYCWVSATEYYAVIWLDPTQPPIQLTGPMDTPYVARGINGLGRIVGQTGTSALYWDSRTAAAQTLPTAPGLTNPVASSINDDGAIVGWALGVTVPNTAPSPYPYPIIWSRREATPVALKLPVPDYCATAICRAQDINDRGEIVGDRCSQAGCNTLYWANQDAVPVELPNGTAGPSSAKAAPVGGLKAAYANPTANGINNAGQAVGAALPPGGVAGGTPLVWIAPNVGPTALPLGNLSYAIAYGIDDAGVVTGVGYDPVAARNVPVVWRPVRNYQGLWWKAPATTESGWGVNLNHEGDTIFATWFTYDLDGKPWWLVVSAARTAPGSNSYSGDLYTGTGPPFNAMPFDPAGVVPAKVGTATFTFTDGDNGTFAYTVNGVAQSKPITRQVFGSPVPACVWGAQPNLSLAVVYQALWWAAPAGVESGWGINLTQQGKVIFASWFTYDADGKPWWLVVSAEETAPGSKVYAGDLYTGTGPPFNAEPFEPSKVAPVKVGTATFTFADGNSATFAYTVDGVSQSKAIVRQVLGQVGTVCQ